MENSMRKAEMDIAKTCRGSPWVHTISNTSPTQKYYERVHPSSLHRFWPLLQPSLVLTTSCPFSTTAPAVLKGQQPARLHLLHWGDQWQKCHKNNMFNGPKMLSVSFEGSIQNENRYLFILVTCGCKVEVALSGGCFTLKSQWVKWLGSWTLCKVWLCSATFNSHKEASIETSDMSHSRWSEKPTRSCITSFF